MNKKDEFFGDICGEEREMLNEKGECFMLNLELYKTKIGTPRIRFSDWTDGNNVKDFFDLHIKEAIELKSIIDNLIIAWHEHQLDEVKNE